MNTIFFVVYALPKTGADGQLVCFGSNSFGQCDVPEAIGATLVLKVATGRMSSIYTVVDPFNRISHTAQASLDGPTPVSQRPEHHLETA